MLTTQQLERIFAHILALGTVFVRYYVVFFGQSVTHRKKGDVPMAECQLPEQFQDLEPYLAWAVPTERERSARRQASTMAEIKPFYDAMMARMEEILPYLAQFPTENVPADVQRLLYLTFSLATVAPAVEMYGEPTVEGLNVARLNPINIYPARS